MFLTILLILLIPIILLIGRLKPKARVPISVNYHFTRRCNYSCGFCFHTAKTSHILPLARAKQGLTLLAAAGMRKLNFAGGEPFLYPVFLGELAKHCKQVLQLESVSVVTNGSKVTEAWLDRYGPFVDILAVSCDSFSAATNTAIGRAEPGRADGDDDTSGGAAHLQRVARLAQLCHTRGIRFKLNTVVNRYNVDEDMNGAIAAIAPFRWKCFQVLVVAGENDASAGSGALRDAARFRISDDEFAAFCRRHERNACFVPEGNAVMRSSYLILDEYMRFLNKGVGEPTQSILDVGVPEAMRGVFWDEEGFERRGGIYDWSRGKTGGEGEEGAGDLDW
jgi:radical S-adenosyl methionine domain-containing protein 2